MIIGIVIEWRYIALKWRCLSHNVYQFVSCVFFFVVVYVFVLVYRVPFRLGAE